MKPCGSFSQTPAESSSEEEEEEYIDDETESEIDFTSQDMLKNINGIIKLCEESCNIRTRNRSTCTVFAIEACARRAASFTVQELAEYIDFKYYELIGTKKTNTGLIRSAESVRLDMRKWGINYSANGNRSYYTGHERPDVIEHRKKIIDYFLAREKMYYRLTEDDDPQWITTPVILISKF
ncbi:unnamed protein product [Didymodactylos carnosus]|uniref:Uncharacterized protein n=1 Tax=Didymodactylos carnosus TaxID=1234261 RepID=A0A815D9I5_9BILA|nr:unnamed protein product [Didymodactylos carnosus]CAF1293362.1 unnamed protein product [Didymodactylos carnosus]CAF3597846.1 unnamed protein product [Didymodactylos carnosus]CAF4103217.1 unnamed protein product [Didymodactylos carnosus]